MLEAYLGQIVVLDLRSSYVCIGRLERVDEQFLEIKHADLHDLRDTQTTRENYVASTHHTGVKRNRKRLLVVRSEIVALTLLDDIVDD